MDTILIVLACTAAATGLVWVLLWFAKRSLSILPNWMNSSVTNSRIIWAAIAIGVASFWLHSLDDLLAADKWSLAFCENLIWIIFLPFAFLTCLKNVLAKLPGATPFPELTKSASVAEEIDIDLDGASKTKVLKALKGGNKLEAVKLCQQASGATLRQAKLFIEDIERSQQTGVTRSVVHDACGVGKASRVDHPGSASLTKATRGCGM